VDDSGTDEDSRSVRGRLAAGTNSVEDGGVVGRAQSSTSNPDDDPSSFVVHKRKAIPTLAQRISRLNNSAAAVAGHEDSGFEDRPAGKPSERPAGSATPSTGRRSRRNSFTEESQLTWENFGGSTDNLHLIQRNRDNDIVLSSAKVAAEARESRAQVSFPYF
jgi:hypothetical protein